MKVVIVGGVAGGATAAARIRRLDEQAEIVVFERSGYISYANCGLPYYIGGIIEDPEDLTLQTPESFFSRFRVHTVQPVHSPFNFINNVRDAIGSGMTGRIIFIAKGFRILLIGKHHLIDGIGRSCCVLKIVSCIVPSATNVDVLTSLGRMIYNEAIMYVTTVFQIWIISASLLAHVF